MFFDQTKLVELTSLVTAALDPQSQIFALGLSEKRQAPPEIAEQVFYSRISDPVATFMSVNNCLSPGLLISNGDGSLAAFNHHQAALVLIKFGLRLGAEAAIEKLTRLLSLQLAVGRHISLVWGVQVARKVMLTEDSEILPLEELMADMRCAQTKKVIEDSGQMMGMRLDPAMLWQKPSAAIIFKREIKPIWSIAGAAPNHAINAYEKLEEIRLGLSCIGPSAPVASIAWFEFDDRDLQEAITWFGQSMTPSEVQHSPSEKVLLDAGELREVFPHYIRLTGNPKQRVHVALHRLNQAKRRRHVGDAAIDLSIALETITGEGDTDITWKVGFRSALLSSTDTAQRIENRNVIKKLYKIRSETVHGHIVKNTPDKVAVVQDASKICANVIKSVIAQGSIPVWTTFEFEALAIPPLNSN